jgi:hypothetical protein
VSIAVFILRMSLGGAGMVADAALVVFAAAMFAADHFTGRDRDG